ncbi:hypothetical protein BSKO_04063 [Bryopsis sp. KO-2023]|nr:hypothetical protein BSKO_04063 [Bryopsis sp. KO-2023]
MYFTARIKSGALDQAEESVTGSIVASRRAGRWPKGRPGGGPSVCPQAETQLGVAASNESPVSGAMECRTEWREAKKATGPREEGSSMPQPPWEIGSVACLHARSGVGRPMRLSKARRIVLSMSSRMAPRPGTS